MIDSSLPAEVEQAVVLCGGRGERLRPLTDLLPKPMAEVGGRPFLEHLLAQLARQGIRRFTLLTGYLGSTISDYFEDGRRWGWRISYGAGPAEWDTGRRLIEASDFLDPRFLLLYGDNYADVDLRFLMHRHLESGAVITLHLAQKPDGNIRLDDDGGVEAYDPSRMSPGLDRVEIGYMLGTRDLLLTNLGELSGAPDLSLSVAIQDLAARGQLAAVPIRGLYESVSDPRRLERTRKVLGVRKILLLDRDGPLNHKAPPGEYVTTWEEFRWIEGAQEALVELAEDGFSFIVITNQAGIARGMVLPEELDRIHRNLVGELGELGVVIEQIYVSPDHWETGSYDRKPEPGLFHRAANEFCFMLERVVYVGDDLRDVEAATNAGCGMVFITSDPLPAGFDDGPGLRHSCATLGEMVTRIQEHYREVADW